MVESSYDVMKFSEKLYNLIQLRGMTQGAVARRAGLAPSAITDMTAGVRRPYMDQALKIAKVLDVPLDYLADDDLDEMPEQLPDDEAHVLRVYKNLKRTGALDEDQAVTGLVALAQTGDRLWGPPPDQEHGTGRPLGLRRETEAFGRVIQERSTPKKAEPKKPGSKQGRDGQSAKDSREKGTEGKS